MRHNFWDTSLTYLKACLKQWIKNLARGHTAAYCHCFRRRVQFDAVQTPEVHGETILQLSVRSTVSMASASGEEGDLVLRGEFYLAVHQ